MASPLKIPAPPSANRSRNWLDLPPELTKSIFHRVGPIVVLMNARKVCKTWRQIGSDPEMWRVLDLMYSPRRDLSIFRKLARKAVDLSSGQLVDLRIDYFADDELLNFIADRSSHLRRLRLISCYRITNDGFSEMVKKLPFLEELRLYQLHISKQAIEVAGQYCPKLKSFELNSLHYDYYPLIGCDEGALAIAENMPGLCHLQLFGNLITRNGLLAILENCPHLESLDIRRCSQAVELGPDLLGRLSQQMKYLRLTDTDSSDDSEGSDMDSD